MAALTPFRRDAPSKCTFRGEPDIYGFGIRLGIYLQWTSVLIVRTFKLRGRASLAKSYIIFIFAIFVALFFMTANTAPSTEDAPKGPYAVEVMTLAYIIFGGVYIVLLTGNDPMPIQSFDVDTVTRLCRQFVFWCVLTAASASYIWFWLDGIQGSDFLETPGGPRNYPIRNESRLARAIRYLRRFNRTPSQSKDLERNARRERVQRYGMLRHLELGLSN
ncbi:hypothetical protein NW757_003637 [Fusarium falciforme]|nr:hypothetical protein NW757_003637 [Fusarium falciforme]